MLRTGIIIILLFLIGCKDSDQSEKVQISGLQFNYEEKKFSFTDPHGVDSIQTDSTIVVTFRYPRILNPELNKGYQAVSEFIDSLLLLGFIDTVKYPNLEKLVESFKANRDEVVNEMASVFEQYWYAHRTIEILDTSKELAAIRCDTDIYTGGAHGINYGIYAMYSLQENRIVPLEYFIKPNTFSQLVAEAEKQFRFMFDIAADSSLNGAFFWFENDKFALPKNFWFDRNGLHFVYNQYEIAPYVLGRIKIDLSYQKIFHLLNSSKFNNWL